MMSCVTRLQLILLALFAATPAMPALADSKLRGNGAAVIVSVVFIALVVLASTMSSKRGHRD